MFMTRSAFAVAALTILSACGGGGGLVDDPVSRSPEAPGSQPISRSALISEIKEVESAARRFEEISGTKFTAMPTAGSGRFEGKGGVDIRPAASRRSQDISIFGDAVLTANFDRNSIRGSITDLVGVQGANPATGRIFGVNGNIVLGRDSSSIGRDTSSKNAVANDASTSFSGRLRTSTNGTFTVNGLAEGKFLGTRPAEAGTVLAPKAIALISANPEIVRNGRQLNGEFFVYGEN